MKAQTAFILIVLVILVILVAHVFACERADADGPKAGGAGGAKAGGGAGAEAGYTHNLLPAGKGPHAHRASLSLKGDGDSTTDMGHSHLVRGFKARPGPDGHVHDITQYVVPTESI